MVLLHGWAALEIGDNVEDSPRARFRLCGDGLWRGLASGLAFHRPEVHLRPEFQQTIQQPAWPDTRPEHQQPGLNKASITNNYAVRRFSWA